MRKIFFDENTQKELMQKGYTKVQLLTDEEVAYVVNELSKLTPDDRFAPTGNEYGSTFHFTFIDTNKDYRQKTNDLLSELFAPHIKRLLVDYTILTCNFYVKPSGRGQLHVHQNWNMTAKKNDTSLTVWCPLIDVDEQNGTLYVVEGSHKIVPNIETYNTTPFFYNFCNSIMERHSKPMRLKAGEGLIFDDSLIHWSADNKSSVPRYVAQALCVPQEATPVFYYPVQNNEGNRFELLELDNEFFIEQSFQDLLNRPDNLKSLGFLENTNAMLSEDAFLKLLKKGDEIRHKIYYPEETNITKSRVSLLSQIKSLFKSRTV